jgi:hypothetical protein
MTISEERKKCVIDLYSNQGKTTHEIAEIERMSIRDISPIIKQESFFSLLAYTQTCKYLFNIFCFSKLINKFSTESRVSDRGNMSLLHIQDYMPFLQR